jgi:hypothetical protein
MMPGETPSEGQPALPEKPANTPQEGLAPSNPLANHPRIANTNPLVDELEAGANPKTVVPDDAVIVRGGKEYQPEPGNIISSQMDLTSVSDAASGLPHGTIRVTTAGEIRATGGTVELIPEPAWEGGPINTWHVNVTEGSEPAFPSETVANPAAAKARLKPPASK